MINLDSSVRYVVDNTIYNAIHRKVNKVVWFTVRNQVHNTLDNRVNVGNATNSVINRVIYEKT